MAQEKPTILIWGIAGASLGMELAKSLVSDGRFAIHGADISPFAFGHFSQLFSKTHKLDPDGFRAQIVDILSNESIQYLIAGGDLVARLCASMEKDIEKCGTKYVGNNARTVSICSDKYECFKLLEKLGEKCPKTILLSDIQTSDFENRYPVVIKPRIESGGSRGIKVVNDAIHLEQLQEDLDGNAWICQEYLTDSNNEFTIGVLSQTDGLCVGAIVLHRLFHSVLSVHDGNNDYMISSGSSQGRFICRTAIARSAMDLAVKLGSTGPLNIQCRLRDGELFPFEINPRFSASTYLRTLAGVNEAAMYVNHLRTKEPIIYPKPREGLAIRSFTETFIANT